MSKFNFDRVRQNIAQVKSDLPPLLANDAQTYFLSSFKKQEWNGVAWQEVKRRQGPGNGDDKGTPEWRYPKNKGLSRRIKPILTGTGRLRREVSNLSGNAKVTYDRFNFTVTLRLNDAMVPYGGYNNNGAKGLPQRKFMGDSPALRRILRNRIERYLNKVWRSAA